VGARVLVVDDDVGIRRVLRATLQAHGYTVDLAVSGEDGLTIAAAERPDVVLLDLTLPGMDGLEVLRELRSWNERPVIVLSARGDEVAKVQALDLGADDYLTKPFGADELLARLRVALRHAARVAVPADPVLRARDLAIDPARRQVTKGGREVRLTPTEYDLLLCLAHHVDRVVTHRTLLQEVWGAAYGEETQYLHVYIGQLRRKIEDNPTQPRLLVTEPGAGYRLRSEDELTTRA